jgi:hypothetical protein
MKNFVRKLELVLNFYKENGFAKTFFKVSSVLKAYITKFKRINGISISQDFNDTNYTNWTEGDLEFRASTVRTQPPRSDVKNFAFYLPQFHEIKENNEWWGPGFTEWTNVKKSIPFFEGHYQPHVPLGDDYYDLSDVQTMEKQAKLAKLFGIDAFVMYYYWFDGRKLLDRPFNHLLNNPELNFPYLICWANESWTRRWDGKSEEILIEQKYEGTFAYDFIEDASKHFSNPNYQKINGRPVLLIYRPEEIPNLKEVTLEWRDTVKSLGFEGLYLISVNSFTNIDSYEFGFDASVNFAPNNMGLTPSKIRNFKGNLFEYNDLVAFNQDRSSTNPVFSCVTPSWDNTARRGKEGTVFLGSTPFKFRNWLMQETRRMKNKFEKYDERVIFINAWNEWAEGSHLEPDEKYGYQWLHAVADCKEEIYWENFYSKKMAQELNDTQDYIFKNQELEVQTYSKLILVLHNLHRNGAQINGLNMLREFKGKGIQVEVIALSGGPLLGDFESLLLRDLIIIDKLPPEKIEIQIASLKSRGYDRAIINSVASGGIAGILSKYEIDIVSLVHEFPETIKEYQLEESAKKVALNSKIVVFPSEYVKDQFSYIAKVKNRTIVLPQGLYNLESQSVWPEWQATKLMQELNWDAKNPIVTGIGYGDMRKGFDIFCRVAEVSSHLNFLWVGDINLGEPEIEKVIKKPPKNLRLVKFQEKISKYLQISDLLLVTSRKDPFPSTVLESLGRGIPVITLSGCTGMEELIKNLDLPVVSSHDPFTISETIHETISKENSLKRETRSVFVREQMNFRSYCLKLLSMHNLDQKTVTAIVPSYNYENYLIARLNQIENQKYTVDQIIFFDDASTDASFAKGCDFLWLSKSKVIVEKNLSNSGSPFSNWPNLIRKSDSDYTWIAETDDIASIHFLSSLVSKEAEFAGLIYCNSAQVDGEGEILASDFSQYLERIKRRNYKNSYFIEGEKEIIDCLSIQNTIPNISAVLFRTSLLKKKLEYFIVSSKNLKTAADWYLYIQILEETSIHYSCLTLNAQRRHNTSVIAYSNKDIIVSEILQIQKLVASRYQLSPDIIEAGKKFIDSIENG